MEKNNKNLRNEDERIDDDQLRDKTTNETIREVNGGRDTDLNNLKESDEESDIEDVGLGNTGDTDLTQGMGYTPNDASGIRSGGIADMDDQTAGGAGLNTGARKGVGSHLNTKKGVSGSDYDGQDATS
jgi:hypothetical protein